MLGMPCVGISASINTEDSFISLNVTEIVFHPAGNVIKNASQGIFNVARELRPCVNGRRIGGFTRLAEIKMPRKMTNASQA